MSEITCSPLMYVGVYNNGTTYEIGNIVIHQGSAYMNRVTSTGVSPDNPTHWGKLTGFAFKGVYNPEVDYSVGDFVTNSSLDRLYISIFEPNLNQGLSNTSRWALIINVAEIINSAVENATNSANFANEKGEFAEEQGNIVSTIVCDIITRIDEINGIIHEVNILKEEWEDTIRPEALQVTIDANEATNNANIATSNANNASDSVVLIWQLPVADFASISSTYPSPSIGWAVQTLDDGKIYRWNDSEWVYILQGSIIPNKHYIWVEEKSITKGNNSLTLTNAVGVGHKLLVKDLTYGVEWFKDLHWDRSGQTLTFTSSMPQNLTFRVINLG